MVVIYTVLCNIKPKMVVAYAKRAMEPTSLVTTADSCEECQLPPAVL